jgi:hypothetical protein
MFRLRVLLAALLARARVVIDPKTPYLQFLHCEVGEPKHIMGEVCSPSVSRLGGWVRGRISGVRSQKSCFLTPDPLTPDP